MNVSVRLHLTIVIAALAGALSLSAAIVAPGLVEDALVDEVVQRSSSSPISRKQNSCSIRWRILGCSRICSSPRETDDEILGAGADKFLRVGSDGSITLFNASPKEIGQPAVAVYDLAQLTFGSGEDFVVPPDGEIVEFGSRETSSLRRRAASTARSPASELHCGWRCLC